MLIPDGFIACQYGPVPAKTHDARLLHESQLLEQLQTVMPEDGNNPIYALYGDLAYAQSACVPGGFCNVDMNSDEAAYNRLLSSVCITVERGFAELVEHWKFLDFLSAMKIFQCPVAQYYIISLIFMVGCPSSPGMMDFTFHVAICSTKLWSTGTIWKG